MSVEKSEINPRAQDQWKLWCEEKFGGLPMEAILSNSVLTTDEEYSVEHDKLFLISKYRLNEIDESQPYILVIDERVLFEEKLSYVGLGEEPKIDYYREEARAYPYYSATADYAITEKSIFNYLDKMSIKEELKGKEILLSSIICAFLNRDCYRMYESFLYVYCDEYSVDDYCIQLLLKQSLLDRDSTIAQIEALSSIRVITPQTEENATAGQESTIESKTETQSIEPPEEIQKLFEPYVEEGELVLSDGAINGKRRYFLSSRSQSSFAFHVREMTRTKGWIEIVPKTLKEWIYKTDGKPYTRDFYSEQQN